MTNSTEYPEKEKKSLLNRILTILLPLIISVVIIYFLLRDINLAELWEILKNANWPILLFSLIFGVLGNTIRAYRWKLLIKPLGYAPSTLRLSLAIFGGYAINYAIPRAGEVWKCGVVAKDEKVPFTKLFGTMLLDRVFDTVTVLFITLIAFVLNMKFFATQLQHNQKTLDTIIAAIKSPTPYIIIGLCILACLLVFKYFKSHKIIIKIKEAVKDMGRDMKAIWKMKEKNKLFLQTIGIWTSYFFYFYITFYAFDFTKDLGVVAGLIAFALSSVSMGIPSNGGLGPWQVAVVAALTLYGVGQVEAVAFATGVFMLQGVWVVFYGLISIGALSFMKKADEPTLVEKDK